jgi:type IV pilus assembly protein PilA
MTVIAVMGVSASIAMPLYQNYAARVQVARVMLEIGRLRVATEECIAGGIVEVGSGDGQCDLRDSSSGLVSRFEPTLSSEPVTLRVTLGDSAAAPLHGQYLTWSRQGDTGWGCRSNVEARYLPSGCMAAE